ncbi:threonine/serine exporter family protein [Erysipelothrix rhusiopathiae]|nr:threonine/serine exporter family protein [Erysipelothrix rhusiopathiae]
MMTIVIQLVSAFAAALGFGIIIDVPKRALFCCGITGMMGWIVNWSLIQKSFDATLAIFIGAATVSMLSMQFAKYLKMPTTVFNIPAIFTLVPGIMAYQTVKAFIGADYILGIELLVRTFTLSVTIAIAIVMTEVIYRLIDRIIQRNFCS